ncbi:MAG: carbon storage regulator [Saccharospirillaceae bacterium]|nr:carbon storage regulator [Saccharospirillaceae bacterium]
MIHLIYIIKLEDGREVIIKIIDISTSNVRLGIDCDKFIIVDREEISNLRKLDNIQ